MSNCFTYASSTVEKASLGTNSTATPRQVSRFQKANSRRKSLKKHTYADQVSLKYFAHRLTGHQKRVINLEATRSES